MRKAKKHLKKYFVPHKHNSYHPHFFRTRSLTAIFIVCIFLLGVSLGNFLFLKKTVLGANIASNVLVDLANGERIKVKAVPLTRNTKLDYAASLKAHDMVENKYFAHNSPDGTTPWFFLKQAGYDFVYAGENLAINFLTSNDVEDAWMNSPSHKANLLNVNFRDVGIATKEGMYNGANSIYVVQMFGSAAKPQLQNVIEDYSKEKEAKKNTVMDSRITENTTTQDLEIPEVKKEAPTNLKTIVETKDFVSVKNLDTLAAAENTNSSEVLGAETYSTVWDRFVFNSSYYIQIFYYVLLVLIFIALLIRSFIEYKKQHFKHFAMSLTFLFVILTIATINLNFIQYF